MELKPIILTQLSPEELGEIIRKVIREEREPARSLTLIEACEYLGITRKTFYNWQANGLIDPLPSKTGRRYYSIESLKKLRP